VYGKEGTTLIDENVVLRCECTHPCADLDVDADADAIVKSGRKLSTFDVNCSHVLTNMHDERWRMSEQTETSQEAAVPPYHC
jgi:hypothetical protein